MRDGTAHPRRYPRACTLGGARAHLQAAGQRAIVSGRAGVLAAGIDYVLELGRDASLRLSTWCADDDTQSSRTTRLHDRAPACWETLAHLQPTLLIGSATLPRYRFFIDPAAPPFPARFGVLDLYDMRVLVWALCAKQARELTQRANASAEQAEVLRRDAEGLSGADIDDGCDPWTGEMRFVADFPGGCAPRERTLPW